MYLCMKKDTKCNTIWSLNYWNDVDVKWRQAASCKWRDAQHATRNRKFIGYTLHCRRLKSGIPTFTEHDTQTI